MLTVDHYARIRQLHRDGLTIREIADQLHHSPKTILKALKNPEPVRPVRQRLPPTPATGESLPTCPACHASETIAMDRSLTHIEYVCPNCAHRWVSRIPKG